MKTVIKKSFVGLFAAMVLAFAAVLTPLTPVANVNAVNCTPDQITAKDTEDCTDTSCAGGTNVASGINCAQGEGVPTNLFGDQSIFTTVVNVLLFIIGAISVIMLIYGGIRYTISGGDSGAVTSAKNTIMYAIIGLIVAFLAFAIVNWVLGAITPA